MSDKGKDQISETGSDRDENVTGKSAPEAVHNAAQYAKHDTEISTEINTEKDIVPDLSEGALGQTNTDGDTVEDVKEPTETPDADDVKASDIMPTPDVDLDIPSDISKENTSEENTSDADVVEPAVSEGETADPDDLAPFVSDILPPEPPAQKSRFRWLLRCAALLVLLAGLGGGAIFWALDQRFDMPDWVRDKAKDRIEAQLGGIKIDFGDIGFVVRHGWRPRLSLRDVTLTQPTGEQIVRLADAQATLSMSALMQGQVRLRQVTLSGLFAVLSRDMDGRLAVRFEDNAAPLREASSVPDMMERWDQYLDLPVLSELSHLETHALTLRYEDQRLGRGWTLDGGRIILSRDQDDVDISAVFALLSGREYASTLEGHYRSAIGDLGAQFSVDIFSIPSEDLATQSSAFGWLNVLRAPISGQLDARIDSTGALLPLKASLTIEEGVIQPEAGLQPVPLAGANSTFTFFPTRGELVFDRFSIESDWVSGNMEGRASLEGVENGQLTDLVGQLSFRDLQLNPLEFYESPLALSGVTLDFKLELAPFRLKLGQLSVHGEDTDLYFSGDVRGGNEGWDYDLTGRADAMSLATLKTFWPTNTSSKPRVWIEDNLLAGAFSDIQFALRGRDGAKPFVAIDADFDAGEVRYLPTLPHLTQTSGHFSLYGNRMSVAAHEGLITPAFGGSLDVSGTTFTIPDTSLKNGAGTGIVRARAAGQVTAVLSMLDTAPLSLMEKVGLPVDLGEGEATARGTLSFPLQDKVTDADLTFDYEGVIVGAKTAQLIPGHVLEAGELLVKGDKTYVEISGDGSLSGAKATATWHQDLGQTPAAVGRISGEVEISAQTIEALGLDFAPDTVSGQGTGEFTVSLPPSGTPELTFSSDLHGVGINLPDLAWRKTQDSRGTLELTALLQEAPVVNDLNFDAPSLTARGTIQSKAGGGLDRADLSYVSLAGWLQGAVELTGRGDATPAVSMTSGRIDLRRIPFESGSSTSSSTGGNTPISLRLSQLQVTDTIALSGFSGDFSTTGGFNGTFSGRLNGDTAITGVVVPQREGLAMRVRSKDAGGVLRSAGILDNGDGGSFEMTLVPAAQVGDYQGQLDIESIRIKRGPAILGLLNGVSLVGLVDELTGQGLLFSEVEADFVLGPEYMTLESMSAVGASIGVSLEGLYNLNTNALDMRGVLSPIYLLNSVGRIFTRKGEGLLGFAFRIGGDSSDPKVSVNPLSALAPGFLREAFRGRKPLKPGEEPPEPRGSWRDGEER